MDQVRQILIVEDEAEMRALLQRYLHSQGFATTCAADARQARTWLARQAFDVILLDVMLPGEDGLSLCRSLRAQGETTPMLMLTARGDPLDRIIGLEMGADDYLPKPFEPRELAARLHALVRRQALARQGQSRSNRENLAFGPYLLDFSRRCLYKHGQELKLTSGEYALLHCLAGNPHLALGRERLLALLQEAGGGSVHRNGKDGVTLRSIDAQIMRLRRLLEEDPAQPRYLQTVWGKGYMFVPGPGTEPCA